METAATQSSISAAKAPSFYRQVAYMLEERKSFGDRRHSPDLSHPNAHPLTNRRIHRERRECFLLIKEIFDSDGKQQKHH